MKVFITENKINCIDLEIHNKKKLKFFHSVDGYNVLFQLIKETFFEFVEEEFFNGNHLLEYAEQQKIPINKNNILKIPHNISADIINIMDDKVPYVKDDINFIALCNFSNSKFLPCLEPFNYINGNIHNGNFTFHTGHFSDVTFYPDLLKFVAIDTHIQHNLCLYWICDRMEFIIESYSLNSLKNLFNSVDEYFKRKKESLENLFYSLSNEIDESLKVNKSKNINYLKFNNLSAKEYIIKNEIFNNPRTSNKQFQMCLDFKKPFNQISKYIEKFGLSY